MKELCLGTAMWGWSIEKSTAFNILDVYYRAGYRYVDTAFNYPINSDPSCLSLAVKYVSEWQKANKVYDLKVVYKFGALSNSKSAQQNLSASNVQLSFECAKKLLGSNLYQMMVHWDNRGVVSDVEETINAMRSLSSDVSLGFSGIRHGELYAKVLASVLSGCSFDIQVKSNFIHQGENEYKSLFDLNSNFWAYGISQGGLKLEASDYRKNSYVSLVREGAYHEKNMNEETVAMIKLALRDNEVLKNIYHYAIAYCEQNPRLVGYIVSPSSLQQMEEVILLRKQLNRCPVIL